MSVVLQKSHRLSTIGNRQLLILFTIDNFFYRHVQNRQLFFIGMFKIENFFSSTLSKSESAKFTWENTQRFGFIEKVFALFSRVHSLRKVFRKRVNCYELILLVQLIWYEVSKAFNDGGLQVAETVHIFFTVKENH